MTKFNRFKKPNTNIVNQAKAQDQSQPQVQPSQVQPSQVQPSQVQPSQVQDLPQKQPNTPRENHRVPKENHREPKENHREPKENHREPKEPKIQTDVMIQKQQTNELLPMLEMPILHSHFYIGFTMSFAVKTMIYQAIEQIFLKKSNQDSLGQTEASENNMGGWYQSNSIMQPSSALMYPSSHPLKKHNPKNLDVQHTNKNQDFQIVPIPNLTFSVFDLGIRPLPNKDIFKSILQKLPKKFAAIKMLFKGWHVEKVNDFYCLSLELKDRYQIFEILKDILGDQLFKFGFEIEKQEARILCAYSKTEIEVPSQLPMHSITINQLCLFQRPTDYEPSNGYEIVHSMMLPKDIPVISEVEEVDLEQQRANILARLEENLKTKQVQPQTKKHRRQKPSDSQEKEIV